MNEGISSGHYISLIASCAVPFSDRPLSRTRIVSLRYPRIGYRGKES